MAKADRKRKIKQKRAQAREMRSEFAIKGPKRRQPNGQPYRPPEAVRSKPTKEVTAKRQILLNGKEGCIDDWIDVAEAQTWLSEDQANALRKFRGVIKAHQMVMEAPHMGRDALAGLLPGRGMPVDDEERNKQIKYAYQDAMAALGNAHRRDSDAVERYITGMAMPLAQSMQRIARASEWLVDHFG